MKKILILLGLFLGVLCYSQDSLYVYNGQVLTVSIGGVDSLLVDVESGGVDSASWNDYTKAWYYEMAESDRPSLDTSDIYNTWYTGIDEMGYFDSKDIGYLLVSKTLDGAKVNIIDPTDYTLTEEGAGNVTHYSYGGVVSGGTNYFETHWDWSTAIHMGAENGGFICYILNDVATENSNMAAFGVDQNTYSEMNLIPNSSSGTVEAAMYHTEPTFGIANSNTIGMYTVSRSARYVTTLSKNDVSIGLSTWNRYSADSDSVTILTKDRANISQFNVGLLMLGDSISVNERDSIYDLTHQLFINLGTIEE